MTSARKLTVEVTGWRPFERNTLQGFATVYVPDMRLTIYDVVVHQKGERRWAQLPSKPLLKDGAPVINADGRIDYAKVLSFDSKEVDRAFSTRVCAALDHYLGREGAE